jgi:hypothetical protein
MTEKLIASSIVAGVIGGYVMILYAVIQLINLINQSYLLSLAM